MSRSEFYYEKATEENEEKALEFEIIHCFEKHKGNYGRIRIRRELNRAGITVSEKKIARVLRANGLVAKSGRSSRGKATKPTAEKYIEENLVKDKFEIKTPNALWCSDISVLKYLRGHLYVCGIIDVATRFIVGWSVGRMQNQQLVRDAFMMAVGRNPNRPEGAIYHSDRGCQYTAKKTKELIEKNKFLKSMSRPGTPHDNQPIESFWRTFGLELPDISQMTFEDAHRVIAEYIELYYNTERIHSGIGYITPKDAFTLLSVQKS